MTKIISEIESQKNKVQKLIELTLQNPELRVLPMVDGELGGCEFTYYAGSFGKVDIDEVFYSDERIYFRSCDVEELEEQAFERQEGYAQTIAGDKHLEEKAREEVNALPWEKVIVVKVELP